MTESESLILGKIDTLQSHMLDGAQRLASIETSLEILVGNGQPGLIKKLEGKVDEHEAALNQAKGAKWVVGILFGLVGLLTSVEGWAHGRELLNVLLLK